ncbi:hypothetical protein ROP_06550 [Rhodococcus opacus B4]|uniref:SnoaL-like domain-containing protein n=1 Tax=Rhodococcus opacus (strain B4) TaxID=632772 RepID=C1ASX0_RHOOB|nr:hypothetical protein ROP_06550 [Rhodococcus opacus B4]
MRCRNPGCDRSPVAGRPLAGRARRRLQGAPAPDDTDPVRQSAVVDAFLAAARGGDFDALLSLLDPDVVLRADTGEIPAGASPVVRGAETVAGRVLGFARLARFANPALVNGTAGVVAISDGQLLSVLGVTVRQGMIVEIDILADRDRLAGLVVENLD